MTNPTSKGRPLGNLPVYKTKKVHLIVDFGARNITNALELTCPRKDCGGTFFVEDPRQTQTRSCPHCFRPSKQV